MSETRRRRPRVPQPGSQKISLQPKEIDEIRSLLKHIESQKKETKENDVVVQAKGPGVKDFSAEHEFVAKVLGISADDQIQKTRIEEDKVRVKINVVEEESDEVTKSSSDSSIGRERFYTSPTLESFTDYQTIHTLIDQLKSPASSSTTLSSSSPETRRRNLLQHYIEKLLGMKREEIANLSVSTWSKSASSSGSFLASTPTSILLSSSDSKSSVGSKTVRFVDQEISAADGSYVDNIQKKKLEIERRTEASLLEIQKTFEAQKGEIEVALQKRLERKVKTVTEEFLQQHSISLSASQNSSTTISEGPLSDSVSCRSTPLQGTTVKSLSR